MKIKLFLMISLYSLTLFLAENPSASDWTTYQHDAQHTGVNNDISFTFPLQLRWEKEISDGPLRPVTVVGNKAIITNFEPVFVGRDPCDPAF